MQDISILFNLIIILLMLFNTFVFQVGLVALLLERFRAMLMFSALYLTFSIVLHSWLMVRALSGVDLCIECKRTSEPESKGFIYPCGKYHLKNAFIRRETMLKETSADYVRVTEI